MPSAVHAETTQLHHDGRFGPHSCTCAVVPVAYEDSPWGFPVFKVGDNNKLFAMMTHSDDNCECELTVKLTPEEREIAMMLPNVRRARYVGRHGWITARITDEESLQTALEWMRESYWLRAPVEFRDAAVESVDDDAR
jgi:predicted DNA-binding protein (MmcQ/YjbR family)